MLKMNYSESPTSIMKKILFIFFFGACLTGVFAQAIPRYWELAGNAGTATRNFLGTTDCAPLIIKTNNLERMRLMSDKSFLGIGTNDPQAPLHIHYQVDSVECGMITLYIIEQQKQIEILREQVNEIHQKNHNK